MLSDTENAKRLRNADTRSIFRHLFESAAWSSREFLSDWLSHSSSSGSLYHVQHESEGWKFRYENVKMRLAFFIVIFSFSHNNKKKMEPKIGSVRKGERENDSQSDYLVANHAQPCRKTQLDPASSATNNDACWYWPFVNKNLYTLPLVAGPTRQGISFPSPW